MVYRHRGEPDEGDLLTGRRTCRVCGERKPKADFHWATARRYRRRACKACDYVRSEDQRASKLDQYRRAARERTFRRKYGLTLAAFDALLTDQNYRCRICWELLFIDTTHVDHDHDSGAVRGLLCPNCNLALGHFRDDPWRLRQALAYLAAATADQRDREDTA